MNTTPGDTAGVPQLHLRTFGTLQLIGSADETILGDHGHQRRRLALLAVLAAAGGRGRSRDQLLGLFWPDNSQDRARHSLEQLLYAIRTSLNGAVFTGVNPVQLNSAFVTSDIGAFTDALERGDLEAAIELYRGPFLEGFYLSDAAEFEQWMDTERGRIERSYTETLEELAKRAETSNDFASAARWRQKLVETDPVSSKHAIGLIRALMNSGDHAAALQYAERYEAIVAKELGTGVGPAVAALVAEVRERAKTESVVVRGAAPPRRQPETESSTPVTADAQAIVQSEATIHRVGSRRRSFPFYGFAAFALLAIALFAWLRPSTDKNPPRSVSESSIAVLPLSNLSGDPHDAAIVDGLTEELIGVLAKIDSLRVVARTSAFVFKNSKLDVRQIADSLRVANILEGGVQKIGQKLRVQVRLIDARDGSTRWSSTYDRELKDVFLMQSDIAGEVARELSLRLGAGAVAALRRQPTKNITAYELYLRGNDRTLLRTDSTARLGLEYFQQATALDPMYASAYAGQARMYLRLRLSDFADTSARRNYVLAREAALKSVALDDSLAEAHAAVGMVRTVGGDFASAEKELNRAVALDPAHSRIREWLAFLHYWQDRPPDALADANRAVENDPLSPTAHAEVGRALCANGQIEQGLARLKTLESVQSPPARVASYVAMCNEKKGDWAAAVAALPKKNAPPISDALLAHALAHAGRREEALGILAQLTNRAKRLNDGAFLVAIVHAGLGDRDQAFAWLNRSVDEASLVSQLVQPLFDDLRGDPRFQDFRRRVGLRTDSASPAAAERRTQSARSSRAERSR